MSDKRNASQWLTNGAGLGVDCVPAIDFQMHTLWTDGRSSVREMIEAAQTRELGAIAITEHVNEGSAWYPDFVAEVRSERQRCDGLEVFFGAEIAAAGYDGSLKADPSRIEAELVLGVVHRYPREGGGFWAFDELRPEDAVELELRALLGLTTNRAIDVLGHPGGIAFRKFGAFPVEWLEPAFIAARHRGIAVELNTKYLWDPDGMLALLRRVDPAVSLGSDAHCAADLGANHSFLLRHLAGSSQQATL